MLKKALLLISVVFIGNVKLHAMDKQSSSLKKSYSISITMEPNSPAKTILIEPKNRRLAFKFLRIYKGRQGVEIYNSTSKGKKKIKAPLSIEVKYRNSKASGKLLHAIESCDSLDEKITLSFFQQVKAMPSMKKHEDIWRFLRVHQCLPSGFEC